MEVKEYTNPQLKRPLSQKFLPLVREATAVHPLEAIGKYYNHPHLYIKREDQTDDIYGGNKIRNLEFIFGKALSEGYQSLITMAPYGSNFTAALAGQAKKYGLKCHLSQFIAQKNIQIDEVGNFCQKHQATANRYSGFIAPLFAAGDLSGKYLGAKVKSERTLYIAPGGSSLLGALGHFKALLELNDQIQTGEILKPDYIILGAGTCGTMAGLLAGIKLCGLDIKILGVRCAEKLMTNKYKVKKLSKDVLDYIGRSELQVTEKDFEIIEISQKHKYGAVAIGAPKVMKLYLNEENLTLDTTYTSKVALYLDEVLKNHEFRGKKLLYWHTYSDKAFKWNHAAIDKYLMGDENEL